MNAGQLEKLKHYVENGGGKKLPYTVSIPPLDYIPDPKGMGHAFFHAMIKFQNKVAQIDSISNTRDLYSDLLSRCVRTAIEMRNRGVTSEHIVCICSHNHLNNIVPFIATIFLGAKIASLDPKLSLSDTAHLLGQVKPKMVFVSDQAESLIESSLQEAAVITELIVFGKSNKYDNFACFIRDKDGEDGFEPAEVGNLLETIIILFSSGTTGLAKGICINHYAMMMQANNFRNCGVTIDVMLGFASTYWISTVLIITLATLNGTARLVASFDPKNVWDQIEKFKVSFIFGAPSLAISLIKGGPSPATYDLTLLKDFLIAGGPLGEGYMLTMRQMIPNTRVHIAYGQTECAGIMTMFNTNNNQDLALLDSQVLSCGKGLPGFEYRVVDLETESTLDFNQSGELRVKTRYQMNGYYNVNSEDCWDSDGWLCTGDVGYYDADRCFYIVDRIKEMLKFQSFHVVPAKIEAVLGSHPAVAVSVVIGIPNEEDGDHPMAVVVRKNFPSVTEQELVDYVAERVDDRHRLRAGVKFVEEVPYTPSGKIKKAVLKKMVLNNEI